MLSKMKALSVAIALLSTNPCFAEADPVEMEKAASSLVISCAIEKLCPPNSLTELDQEFTSMKTEASAKLGGMNCASPEIEAILADASFASDLSHLISDVAANGSTTCLSAVPN